VTGEAQARLPARVLRLSPGRRLATVTLKGVGGGQSFAGAYAGRTGQLAPVADGAPFSRGRQLGRLVKVNPTATGAELDLIIGDDDTWQSLAAGTARVDAVVAFTSSSSGEPTGGRPLRVEVS
jgi:hypothetical protein